MDYDQVAMFLSKCTTRGLRRSLQIAPYDTLTQCGFQGPEISWLTQSLTKQQYGGNSWFEQTSVSLAFQSITPTSVGHKKRLHDDWWAAP